MLPGAHLVKAFNHLTPALLAHPSGEGGKRVLFYSGEHGPSKQGVGSLIDELGFHGIDLGSLERASCAISRRSASGPELGQAWIKPRTRAPEHRRIGVANMALGCLPKPAQSVLY